MDEPDDGLGEIGAGVLLDEVAGVADRNVLDASSSGDSVPHPLVTTCRDRVTVAEGAQEGPVETGERLPGGPLSGGGRVVRGVGHQARERSDAGQVALVGEGRVVPGPRLVGQPPPAACGDEPSDVQVGRGLHRLPESPPHSRHGDVARGKAGVGHDDTGEPVGMLSDQAQPEESAPVLAEVGDLAQVQRVEQGLPQPRDVPGIGVVRPLGRLVGPAEPDEVGRERVQARVGEDRQHGPVEIGPCRLAVHEHDGRPVSRAGLDVRHAQPVGKRDESRLVWEVGERGESFLGSAEDIHAAHSAARPRR